MPIPSEAEAPMHLGLTDRWSAWGGYHREQSCQPGYFNTLWPSFSNQV